MERHPHAGIAADRPASPCSWTGRRHSTLCRAPPLKTVAERAPPLLLRCLDAWQRSRHNGSRGAARRAAALRARCAGDLRPLFFALTLREPSSACSPEPTAAATLARHRPAGAACGSDPLLHVLADLGGHIGLEARLRGAQSTRKRRGSPQQQHWASPRDAEPRGGHASGHSSLHFSSGQRRADAACASMDRMMALPLSAQDKFILLRCSPAAAPRAPAAARSQWRHIDSLRHKLLAWWRQPAILQPERRRTAPPGSSLAAATGRGPPSASAASQNRLPVRAQRSQRRLVRQARCGSAPLPGPLAPTCSTPGPVRADATLADEPCRPVGLHPGRAAEG
jgi:hypothetical protein